MDGSDYHRLTPFHFASLPDAPVIRSAQLTQRQWHHPYRAADIIRCYYVLLVLFSPGSRQKAPLASPPSQDDFLHMQVNYIPDAN